MRPFAFDPQQLAAIGLSPKDIEELAQTAQVEIDHEKAALASVSGSCDQATAAQCAELGCRYGRRGPYWARWTAIQDARGLSGAERLRELPPRAPRWLALWAYDIGDTATFDIAYTYHLQLVDADKVGPIAHENSLYFAHLFRNADYSRIQDTFSTFFSGGHNAPGTNGYLYERVWFIFASVAAGSAIPLVLAEKLVLQFPAEGGAWAAVAVARSATGDANGAAIAWAQAKACEFIEADARKVACELLQPKA